MVCESIRQSRFLFCTPMISLSWLRQIMYLYTYIDEYGWAAQMLFLLQCTVFVSARFDLNQDCYVYACALAVGKNQSDFIPRYFPQVIVALFLALRPLPHVSGYFWIRNFFFADSNPICPSSRIRIHSQFVSSFVKTDSRLMRKFKNCFADKIVPPALVRWCNLFVTWKEASECLAAVWYNWSVQ